jgi:hypothetical protein
MAITLDVANVGTGESDGSATVALTTGATVAVGARIFVGVGADVSGADLTVTSISGGGLTWVIEGTLSDTTIGYGAGVALAYADAPAGLASGTTITATWSVAPFNSVIAASSYLGISGTRDVERTDTLAATAAWVTGSLTTSEAGEMVITALCSRLVGTAITSAPSSGVEDQDFDGATQGELILLQRRIEATAGAYTLAGTISATPESTVAVTAAYKAAPELYANPGYSDFPKYLLAGGTTV